MNQRSFPVTIVLPDAGPLISLAKAEALDLLLVFGDDVRIVITDFVEFEVTRFRTDHADAQAVADFILKNAGRIEIERTSIGEALIQQYKLRERYDEDPMFRQSLDAAGLAPRDIPSDSGELSIISFVNGMTTNPPGRPVLILAEDDFFLGSAAAIPGNAHILSTSSFIDVLGRMGRIKSAKHIWERIKEARPMVNQDQVDRSARKIRTTWTDRIDEEKSLSVDKNLRKSTRPKP